MIRSSHRLLLIFCLLSVICWTYLTLRRLLPACRLPPAPPAGHALPAAH